jgi:hypothetical protein
VVEGVLFSSREERVLFYIISYLAIQYRIFLQQEQMRAEQRKDSKLELGLGIGFGFVV